jgi:putative flavoprotein involved in K+ transport
MADYLAAYADRFELPVRTGVRVDRLAREQNRFTAYAGDRRFEAENVIVAMASYQEPWVPDFAEAVDPGILQMHSAEYRNPRQLRDGPVLLVGAGNSSSEIAIEVATHHEVSMSGRDTGQLPFRIGGLPARVAFVPLVLRVLFHRVLTVSTPIGRKVRPKMLQHGGPLIRVRGKELERAGVTRVPRTIGVRDGMPLLEDGRTLEPANVIWCTGFRPGFHWIDLPIHGRWEPRHRSGIVPDAPGLYFVGLHFLHAMSSTMIHGVGRDAARVVDHIARRRPGQGAHDGNQKREVRVAG